MIFILILLFTIPIVILCLAAPTTNHVVSRSASLKFSTKKLWQILTNISEYPNWQSKVEAINIDKVDLQQQQVVFVEYSTSNRHTVIRQHEVTPMRRLVRIIEDSDSLSEDYQFKKKRPSFSGSWTFDILDEESDDDTVMLRITQQGTINNPMARIFHFFVLGYLYRIDRFFNDLQSFVEPETSCLDGSFSIPDYVSPSDLAVVSKDNEVPHVDIKASESHAAADDTPCDQQFEAAEESLIKSKLEWDLVSEIYEHP